MQTSQIKFELSLLKLQNEISAKSLRKCSHMNCPSSRVADELSILTQLILQTKWLRWLRTNIQIAPPTVKG